MTKAEAYKVLGTSSSAGRSKAELLYREKCRTLRLQMVPGMPVAVRQNAQAELARIGAAWQVIQAPGAAQRAKKKTAAKKAAGPTPTHIPPYRKPQTLGEAWGQVVAMMPFSEPVAAVVMILALLVTIMVVLTHL